PVGLLERLIGRNKTTGPAASPHTSEPPRAARFAVIDVETTGLSPEDDRIIELAIIRADEHGRFIDRWVSRFRPEQPVGATLAHAPRFAELAVTVGRALQGLVVVAHNADFDLSFLRAEFARASLPMPTVTTYCTLQGSSLYLPQLRRRRLGDCCAMLDITIEK